LAALLARHGTLSVAYQSGFERPGYDRTDRYPVRHSYSITGARVNVNFSKDLFEKTFWTPFHGGGLTRNAEGC
jgi:hypothetical protein